MEQEDPGPSRGARLRRLVVGKARNLEDPSTFHRLSLVAFFAWVGLGADGLSSSCYGPPEAFQMLGEHAHLAIFVSLGTAFTIMVIATSYSQIIEVFPSGGGGYLVASQLLSPAIGMVSGCALLIDYALTISLSISSGAEAIFSFFPPGFFHYRIFFAFLGVIVLTALNLRGAKESVVPLLPVFMLFVGCHVLAILYTLIAYSPQVGAMAHQTANEVSTVTSQVGLWGLLVIILRAYSMGAGTYTGIEAVSNGLPILREPKVKTGKRTMLYMGVSLVLMVIGLMLAFTLAQVTRAEGKTLNAVLLETITGNWPAHLGRTFVFITLFSEAAILFVGAQAGFLDGPRVLANMALDRWMPNRFATLSDRLVTQNGVVLMGGVALLTIILTSGSVEILLTLYSITVFITFVLSQLGMVRHWWKGRGQLPGWKKGILINGTGLILTSFILVSITVAKFEGGGWITLLVTGSLIAIAAAIRRHYGHTMKLLKRLDVLVEASKVEIQREEPVKIPERDETAKTAVILVNGFNGLGLHTLFNVKKMFGETFKNYVFIQVGIVDAGTFKGAQELDRLREHVDAQVKQYVDFMKREGFYAEGVASVGTDVVEEILKLAPTILQRFPQSIFFGGQLVFPEETVWTRWLHNYIVFSTQRRLYSRGIPFMIVPIRV